MFSYINQKYGDIQIDEKPLDFNLAERVKNLQGYAFHKKALKYNDNKTYKDRNKVSNNLTV